VTNNSIPTWKNEFIEKFYKKSNNKELNKPRLNIRNDIINKYDKEIFYSYLLNEYMEVGKNDKNTI